MIKRFVHNPIISPQEVRPSAPDLEVMCAFNPGATERDGEILLLLRVAERPIPEPGWLSTAILDPEKPGGYSLLRVRRDDPELEFSDPRCLTYKNIPYLTSISHLRLARSAGGRDFTVDDTPALMPAGPFETYGIEDPRITFLDGAWYINYSAISLRGVATALARTTDFVRYERLGIIFPPDNKDVAIFPEKIGDRYYAFHRPSMRHLGVPSLWLASSDNLLDWGRHHFVIGPRPGMWDAERVGCGAAPIRTEAGWLQIYHGADHHTCYQSGALLLDLDEPWKVIARSREPLLRPETTYENEGLMPNVVFSNGLVECGDGTVVLYYGAADTVTCGAVMDVQQVLASLREPG